MSNKPNIIISPDAQADFAFNGSELETLTNDFGITSTPTILLDNKNRLTVKGVTYPKLLGRMRFFYDKDLRQAEGPIVRVSTRLRGQQRSQAALNKTFAHEMEHVAQIDRRDVKMAIGQIALWGLAITGAYIANQLGNQDNLAASAAITLLGASAGLEIGYRLAPHEAEARQVAEDSNLTVIERVNT